jgi:monodictyphenone polyketide synthase
MLIVEEAPSSTLPRAEDPRPTQVVALSGKTKTALAGNIQRLIDHLDDNIGKISLADLGYTTTARRYQHSYRVAVTASTIAQLRAQLVSQSDKIETIRPVSKSSSSSPSVAFAFTGQGASYRSMSLELYRDVHVFRKHIQHLDAIAQGQGFPSFIPALDGSHTRDYEGHSAVVTQLALVCIEIALAHYWSASLGVTPDVVIGHSLGEYAAMHVAGVISANDAIFMVGYVAKGVNPIDISDMC